MNNRPRSSVNKEPNQPRPARRRRRSAVLIESAITAIRRLQDEIEVEPGGRAIPSTPVMVKCSVRSRLLLKDGEADREFTEGMSKYFDSNDRDAANHFSRAVEIRQDIQEDIAAFALFEDDAIRQRHERQLRHAKLCLDDMAGKPSKAVNTKKKTADSALLVDFVSPSTRRIKIAKRRNQTENHSRNGSDCSLCMECNRGDDLECDGPSCSDSFLLDAQVNRRMCTSPAYNTAKCPPAIVTENDDAKLWQYPVKQMEIGKPFSDTDKPPKEIELFAAKTNIGVEAFHNSCVSDLYWDSAASFHLGGDDANDLCWASTNFGKAVAATKSNAVFVPEMIRRSSVSRAA